MPFIKSITSAAAALFLLAPSGAQAHSWYPKACCHDQDCEALPMSAISEEGSGFRVQYVSPRFGPIDEIVPYAKVRASEDGDYHGCWTKDAMRVRSICFFAPMNA